MTERVIVRIDNVYEEHDTVVVWVRVPLPEAGENIDQWAEDNIFPLTGAGKYHGNAGYFAKVSAAPGRCAHLIGRTFEWGV